MIRKITIARTALIAALAIGSLTNVHAQDIHFTQFEAAPLVINPAFTGDFDGQLRAAAIYRTQWASITTPYITYGASIDAPIVHDLSIDDYLAAGLQVYNDKAGDGNLTNFTVLGSIAYHKFLGAKVDKVISVGLQGGYSEKSIDLSKLYFQDEFVNGGFNQGTSPQYGILNNRVHYFSVNAGISFAHNVSNNFSYQLGAGANNLNQPNDGFAKTSGQDAGLGMRYTGQAGFILYVSEKFSLRPGVLYQSQSTANEIIAGNEFHYIIGNPEIRTFATAVFLGAWWRTGDAVMATAGFEYKSFRFGVSYDYNISDLKTATNGNGGFEISLRYIAPNPLDFARRLVYPCSRF
ncbi:MAG: PorP/SprF family type IX secretion system membrane protein [Taibaiella sp.]|nr:PorP/SprF family type IX secretion system membrane protein [Taibaiella sp.]